MSQLMKDCTNGTKWEMGKFDVCVCVCVCVLCVCVHVSACIFSQISSILY